MGLMVYSPSKSVLVPATWFPFKNRITLAKGKDSLVSKSVIRPLSVPAPTCAKALKDIKIAPKNVANRIMRLEFQAIQV